MDSEAFSRHYGRLGYEIHNPVLAHQQRRPITALTCSFACDLDKPLEAPTVYYTTGQPEDVRGDSLGDPLKLMVACFPHETCRGTTALITSKTRRAVRVGDLQLPFRLCMQRARLCALKKNSVEYVMVNVSRNNHMIGSYYEVRPSDVGPCTSTTNGGSKYDWRES